jgi:hypothetical protein
MLDLRDKNLRHRAKPALRMLMAQYAVLADAGAISETAEALLIQ